MINTDKKFCSGCNKDLPKNNFRTNKTKKDGLQSQCINCKKIYNKEHYKKNKQYYVDKAKTSNQKTRDWYRDIKSSLKCQKCGEDHPACLHFHHRNPECKEFGIGSNVISVSKTRLAEEIAKCDVLCANCHAKTHYDIKNYSPIV